MITILDATKPELKLTMEGKVILNKYTQAKEKKAKEEEAKEEEAKEEEAKEEEVSINNETIKDYIKKNMTITPAKNVYFFEDKNDTPFDGTYEFDESVNILDKLDNMFKPLECDFNGFAKINGESYYAFSSIYRTVKGLHLIYFRPVEVQEKGEEVPPTGDVEGTPPAEGGRRRRKHNKRTRKHRLTKRIKLGKGKRKTKKHSKKTKRRRRM